LVVRLPLSSTNSGLQLTGQTPFCIGQFRRDDGRSSSSSRDFEYARSTNQPVRQDIQRARRIIARQSFSGLFCALERGVALPAFVRPLVELLRRQQEQPSGG
jgi:hypothetical protein